MCYSQYCLKSSPLCEYQHNSNIIQFSVVSSVQVYLLDSKLQPLTPLPLCPSFCIVCNLKQYSYVVCLLSPNFGEVDPMVKLTILQSHAVTWSMPGWVRDTTCSQRHHILKDTTCSGYDVLMQVPFKLSYWSWPMFIRSSASSRVADVQYDPNKCFDG